MSNIPSGTTAEHNSSSSKDLTRVPYAAFARFQNHEILSEAFHPAVWIVTVTLWIASTIKLWGVVPDNWHVVTILALWVGGPLFLFKVVWPKVMSKKVSCASKRKLLYAIHCVEDTNVILPPLPNAKNMTYGELDAWLKKAREHMITHNREVKKRECMRCDEELARKGNASITTDSGGRF